MIRLYHGTNIRIEHPDCLAGRDNLDFGKGFYTTLLREHAEQWAGQVSFNRGGHPVVNVYELDKEAAESEFSYLQFPLYDEAWMDFIVASRLGQKPWQGYDFIEMHPNTPIGVLPGLEFVGDEIESIMGKPLFVYTDGLNEAENPAHEQFGDERLLHFFRNCRYESAQQVIETIVADVEKHRNGAEPNDDLTMMCLTIKDTKD